MINSNWITQALYVTAHLGLPDFLASGPKTSAYLAQATGAHGPSRVLSCQDLRAVRVMERIVGGGDLLFGRAKGVGGGVTAPGPSRAAWGGCRVVRRGCGRRCTGE